MENKRDEATDSKPVNPDPLTGAPGSHPIGTGIGSVSGAAAGAAAGAAVAGPAGALVGGAIGAVAGGVTGHAVGEGVNPTAPESTPLIPQEEPPPGRSSFLNL